MENTMEIMTNEEVIETEDTCGEIVEYEEPVEDLDEGLEDESNSLVNVGTVLVGVGLVTATGYGLAKLGKKIWKTNRVKKLRGKIGNAITKGLDEEEIPAVESVKVIDNAENDAE